MSPALFVIIIVIVFSVITLSAYFYLEKTKEKRLRKIRKESRLSPEDRAYNKVKRAEGVTRMMKRKGKEVDKAKEMVDKAEDALHKGKVNQAEKLASKVDDDISGVHNGGEKQDNSEMKKAYTVDELEEVEFKDSKKGDKKRRELERQKKKLESLPDNYLESKFELKVAKELIEKEDQDEKAKKYFAKAEDCFENEDYTESLRYSIKCKKQIEGEEGAGLIAGQNIDKKESPPEEVKEKYPDLIGEQEEKPRSSDEGLDESVSTKDVSAGNNKLIKRCPDCDFEGGEDDLYCPKCGVELITELNCPECGEEVEEEDEFCRKCGSPLDESQFVCPDCGREVDPEDEFCPGCGIEFE